MEQRRVIVEQQIDEVNKIIHIKCTEEEKRKFLDEITYYPLYDYNFNFLIIEKTKVIK
jgi:hypothetical protein